MLAAGTRAVVFDYGSTLVEFSRVQVAALDTLLGDALEREYGHVDRAEVVRRRNRDRMAPYTAPYRENDLRAITHSLVEDLYGSEASPALVDELLAIRRRGLLEAVVAPPYLADVLGRIAARYRLGLLSNYPCGETIRASVARVEIESLFDTIVVSADVGHVKPHPLPFARVVEQLGVAAGECVMVGDNWLGDIQGAKRAGMKAVHSTQFDTPEKFTPGPDDVAADATIGHLDELLALLGV